jgi:multidrug resistance efflux pump
MNIYLTEFRRQALRNETRRKWDMFITALVVLIIFYLLIWSCFQFQGMRNSADKAKAGHTTQIAKVMRGNK